MIAPSADLVLGMLVLVPVSSIRVLALTSLRILSVRIVPSLAVWILSVLVGWVNVGSEASILRVTVRILRSAIRIGLAKIGPEPSRLVSVPKLRIRWLGRVWLALLRIVSFESTPHVASKIHRALGELIVGVCPVLGILDQVLSVESSCSRAILHNSVESLELTMDHRVISDSVSHPDVVILRS